MAKCKYKKREHLISYDGGQSWVIDEVIKGDLVQSQSPDCPDSGSEITKWVVLDNDFICEDKNKYQKEVMYVSYDEGVSWYINFPTVYRKGILIGVDETFCNNKFEGHYIITGKKIDPLKIIKCDSSTTLSKDDVKYYKNSPYVTDIVSAKIGDCITSIGSNAFSGCTSLTNVIFGDAVTSIENNAFQGCTSLPVVDGIRYADWYIVEVIDKTKTTYTINPNAKVIPSNAFQGCTSLTSIDIPDSVTSIDNRAFSGDTSLTTCTIGSGLTSIGNYVFSDCSGLTSIDIPSGVTSIGNYAFHGCRSLTNTNIPSSVTSIGTFAFGNCSSLRSVDIPSGVTSISFGTFWSCSGLTSIDIPSGVTSIGDNAFRLCTGLKRCTIGDGVTSIGDNCFGYCRSLETINLPSGITSIGTNAFQYCSGLTTLVIAATTPPTLGYDALYGTNSSLNIYVPSASVDAYKSASRWSTYASRIFAMP